MDLIGIATFASSVEKLGIIGILVILVIYLNYQNKICIGKLLEAFKQLEDRYTSVKTNIELNNEVLKEILKALRK